MWSRGSWEQEENLMDDLLLLAEYTTFPSKTEDIKVPDTIKQYRKQMAENRQKPLNSDIDDNLSYIISGRGRGMQDRVVRPGGLVDSHPADEVELKKKIREVAGFGYSNELIEQSIKAKSYDPEKNSDSNPSFRFVSSQSSSSGSDNSSANSPKKKPKAKSNRVKDDFPPLK